MGRDGEGGKKEVKGWKGRKDLPDQCQTASYAPAASHRTGRASKDINANGHHTTHTHTQTMRNSCRKA